MAHIGNMKFLQKIRCLFRLHEWVPDNLQIWISECYGLAAYKDAKCKYCTANATAAHLTKEQFFHATTFFLKDIPLDQVMGKYPYQVTNDGGLLWYTVGYGPPDGYGLKKYGNL